MAIDWEAEITAALKRTKRHVRRTPVMEVDLGFENLVEIKLEQLQHTGSFKARGAFNTLLASDVPEAGVVAASGGNHGAAVAYAASQLDYPAKIFVPEIAGPSKIALIEDQEADLEVVPGLYSNAMELAEAHEAETGAMQVHAYDAVLTIAGQGSLSAEWEDQGLEADTVLIAVGGGGLIAGALAWMGDRRDIVAVEPETSRALDAALEAGEPIAVEVSGVAANALGATKIGQMAFDMAEENDIETVLVSDKAITRAQEFLWQRLRLLVEPAGATALAALMSGVYVPEPDERVAVLVCGGNIAPDPLQRA